jgi:hypothetical protein
MDSRFNAGLETGIAEQDSAKSYQRGFDHPELIFTRHAATRGGSAQLDKDLALLTDVTQSFTAKIR